MPIISVVVPVYKVEKYLNRCVDSILNQTYKDFELILVDDGSPDKAPEICDDYAKKFDFIHVIHQKNGGLSAARNSGIEWVLENSDSEWITFIDSDDWVHPQYLESMVVACERYNTDICFGRDFISDSFYISDEYNPYEKIFIASTEEAFMNKTLDANAICSRLFKKFLFNEIRFPEGKLHEDRFTSYRVYFQVKRVSVVDYPIYYYFSNDESIVHAEWSPKKMDDLEAAENQLEFFKYNNYPVVFEFILRDYIHLMVVDLRKIKNNQKYQRYEKIIRNKLCHTLKTYEKVLNMNFSKDFNTYKYAYPLKAKVYNRLKMLKKQEGYNGNNNQQRR